MRIADFTLSVEDSSTTKKAEMLRNPDFFVYSYLIHAQRPLQFFLFSSLDVFTTSTLSPLFLQLALRAPSSLSRGRDCVSSVHSTVAPPSRRPRSAAAVTAITAATWTNRRTRAPVSHMQYEQASCNTPRVFPEWHGGVLHREQHT